MNEMRKGKYMNNLIKIFKALSDKNRLRILLLLTKKSLCVCEIQDILGVTVSTVSNHLSILRDIGFILDEKDGKWVNYRLNTASKDIVMNQIILLLPFYLNDDELIKSDLEKVNNVCRKNLCNL
jgi:ArsR family transcriptional regulator